MPMSLLSAHPGELNGSRGRSRSAVARKVVAFLKRMHCAIIAAKLHRLRNELMLRRSTFANSPPRAERDAAEFPQRPLLLGDKWDF
jgi:hypothetical protein